MYGTAVDGCGLAAPACCMCSSPGGPARTASLPHAALAPPPTPAPQVELRVLAHLSADPALVRLLQQGGQDAFTLIASKWLGSGAF